MRDQLDSCEGVVVRKRKPLRCFVYRYSQKDRFNYVISAHAQMVMIIIGTIPIGKNIFYPKRNCV